MPREQVEIAAVVLLPHDRDPVACYNDGEEFVQLGDDFGSVRILRRSAGRVFPDGLGNRTNFAFR